MPGTAASNEPESATPIQPTLTMRGLPGNNPVKARFAASGAPALGPSTCVRPSAIAATSPLEREALAERAGSADSSHSFAATGMATPTASFVLAAVMINDAEMIPPISALADVSRSVQRKEERMAERVKGMADAACGLETAC
eukprot:scaffold203514_cov32-Tisochrysis_lutea.AAC.2